MCVIVAILSAAPHLGNEEATHQAETPPNTMLRNNYADQVYSRQYRAVIAHCVQSKGQLADTADMIVATSAAKSH